LSITRQIAQVAAFALASRAELYPRVVCDVVVIALDCFVIFACYKALVWGGSVLILEEQIKAHEANLDNGGSDNSDSKPNQCFREPSQFDCLIYEPRRLIRQIFSLFPRFFGKLFLSVCHLNEFSRLLRKFVGGFFGVFRKQDKQARHLNGQKTVSGNRVVQVDILHTGRHGLLHFLNNLVRFRIHNSNMMKTAPCQHNNRQQQADNRPNREAFGVPPFAKIARPFFSVPKTNRNDKGRSSDPGQH